MALRRCGLFLVSNIAGLRIRRSVYQMHVTRFCMRRSLLPCKWFMPLSSGFQRNPQHVFWVPRLYRDLWSTVCIKALYLKSSLAGNYIIGSVFGPFSAKLGPQVPLERRSSFCSAGCTKYQAGRLILRPCRGTKKICGQIAFRYPVMQVGPRAYAGWLQVPRSETGAELNLGGLPPPRAPGGLKGGHSPARGSAWGAPYDSAPIPFQTGGLL